MIWKLMCKNHEQIENGEEKRKKPTEDPEIREEVTYKEKNVTANPTEDTDEDEEVTCRETSEKVTVIGEIIDEMIEKMMNEKELDAIKGQHFTARSWVSASITLTA